MKNVLVAIAVAAGVGAIAGGAMPTLGALSGAVAGIALLVISASFYVMINGGGSE